MKPPARLAAIVCMIGVVLYLAPTGVGACTLVKMTVKGKTVVGNNEDAYNADTRIWFEPGAGTELGAVYVGFDHLIPEGGVNEAGLMFDAFGMSNKPLKDTTGKAPIFELNLKRRIMKECSSVEEVRALLEKHNLYFWSHSVWVFVDRAGKYLVVDGDSVASGNAQYFVQTNFRQCEIKDASEITCQRYLKAMSLLKSRCEANAQYCASLMDSVHQQTTLYTTIYDLDAGTIDLYNFHNYSHVIRFNIKEELKKGKKVLRIPDLFPDVVNPACKGMHDMKAKFDSLAFYPAAYDSATRAAIINDLTKRDYVIHVLGNHGYEFLHEGDIQKAVGIFKLIQEMYPKMPHGYDFLGEAYMESKQYELALANYRRSVEMYPANVNGRQRIDVLQELLKK